MILALFQTIKRFNNSRITSYRSSRCSRKPTSRTLRIGAPASLQRHPSCLPRLQQNTSSCLSVSRVVLPTCILLEAEQLCLSLPCAAPFRAALAFSVGVESICSVLAFPVPQSPSAIRQLHRPTSAASSAQHPSTEDHLHQSWSILSDYTRPHHRHPRSLKQPRLLPTTDARLPTTPHPQQSKKPWPEISAHDLPPTWPRRELQPAPSPLLPPNNAPAP